MPTPRELQDEILHGPYAASCAAFVHTAEMDKISGVEARRKDQAIADILNSSGAFRTLVPRPIGIGTVLNTLGPADGAVVMDALYALSATVRPLHYALMLLERGDLDVGLPAVRGQIDALVPAVFSEGQATLLKLLAEEPEIVTAAQVSVALRGPWEDE